MERGIGSIQKYGLNNLRPNKCDVFATLLQDMAMWRE